MTAGFRSPTLGASNAVTNQKSFNFNSLLWSDTHLPDIFVVAARGPHRDPAQIITEELIPSQVDIILWQKTHFESTSTIQTNYTRYRHSSYSGVFL